jgi:hypothetical protein
LDSRSGSRPKFMWAGALPDPEVLGLPILKMPEKKDERY